MAQKQIYIEQIGLVILRKRKDTRNIRLTIGYDGTPRVSMPNWSPYKVGEAFALSKISWILQQQASKTKHLLKDGERVGKNHRVRFVKEIRSTVTSRITKTELIIRFPLNDTTTDENVQKAAHAGAIRALKQEAKHLLPQRLKLLAEKHGFSYRSIRVKHLKSRWGSCNSNKDITLNCFLMQLPWELIDYVLCHELLHTRIMAHGQEFWSELELYVSDLSAKRKTIRNLLPIIKSEY